LHPCLISLFFLQVRGQVQGVSEMPTQLCTALRYAKIMRYANSMNSCAASVGVQRGMIATACAAALRIRLLPFSSVQTRGMGRRAEDKNGESRDINLAKGVQPRVTVVQLRSMLRAMGLPATGTKTELVERIQLSNRAQKIQEEVLKSFPTSEFAQRTNSEVTLLRISLGV
jgi:hypothetical protein